MPKGNNHVAVPKNYGGGDGYCLLGDVEIGGGGGGERGNGEINKEAPAVGQPMMMIMVWIIVVAVKRGDTKRKGKGKGWIEDHSQLSGLNNWVVGKYQF